MPIDDEPVITQTVRDILGEHSKKMDEGFTKINTRLDTMATKADLQSVHSRVDKVETRIGDMETARTREAAIKDFKGTLIRYSGWLIAGVIVPIASVAIYHFAK